MTLQISRFGFVLALAALAGAAPAGAQQYPVKPVRIIVPFPPGGTSDILGRLVATRLTESLGQTFIVENRPGAGGLIGLEQLTTSAPDGYTLGVTGAAPSVIAPLLAKKPPYDPIGEFTHIALFGGPPSVFGVHPSLPAKSLKAFIAFAKARPGELTYGSPGNGTQGHLIGELFKQKAGIKIVHVPYKGAAFAVVDVVAGHIHAISTTLTTASAQVRAGRVRALAISSGARLPDYPGVSTFRELGYPDLVATIWFSLSGPAGVPPEIVNRLNGEVRRILQLPDVRERLSRDGIEPNQLDARAFTEFVIAEIKRWGPVVRASGARAD
ncbi:MAG TPA: tripartite tricarboxylate transporter substrate binding protein [Burkholderiales bacterium]|nr:tripartite tricarboxylate transporter substrate binding protein [Burkholderiales bacterium]